MSHWCLKDVDYDKLDFFEKPVPELPKRNYLASRSSSRLSSWASSASTSTIGDKSPTSSPEPDSPRSGSAGQSPISSPRHGRSSVASPPSTPRDLALFTFQREAATSPQPPGSPTLSSPREGGARSWVEVNLRQAILTKERHCDIPKIIADWPLSTLSLSRVISPEACERLFVSMETLWTHVFQGLLTMTSHCHLSCLDLSRFLPTKGMLYTMLQLVPLLSIPGELRKTCIYDRVVDKFRIQESGALQNLSHFLDTMVRHPVFHRGRRITLPEGQLEIIIDYLPLAADKLSFLCWMTASAIEDLSHVTIKPNSIVFTYSEIWTELCPTHPMLPLRLLPKCQHSQGTVGIALESVPPAAVAEVLSDLLPAIAAHAELLDKLALPYCNLALQGSTQLQGRLLDVLSQMRSLNRLDLSGAKLAGCLGRILGALVLPLQFLNLDHCSLVLSDIEALLGSKHVSGMRDMNLSHVYSADCDECVHPYRSPLLDEIDVPSLSRDRELGSPFSWTDEGSSPRSMCTSPVGGGDSWNFWSTQRSISSPTPQCGQQHGEDHVLLQLIFAQLHRFKQLTILDMNCDKLGAFRVQGDLLNLLLASLSKLPRLKHLAIEDVPLWDDDIFTVVRRVSSLPGLQSLALTRAPEAPKLQVSDRFVFWKRMHKAKSGKTLRLSIGNFVDEEIYSIPESFVDDDLAETISGLDLQQ